MFWDVLDFPEQFAIGFGLNTDLQFLRECRILQRTRIDVPGGQFSDILRAAHVGAFHILERQEPGCWSLAAGADSLNFFDDELEEGRGALLKLYKSIPVPNQDVPLAEVLDFREKRRDELLALRTHMDELYQALIIGEDSHLAWNTTIAKLDTALQDHVKAFQETKFSWKLLSIEASLNIPLGVMAFPDQPLLGTILGAASISIKQGPKLKSKSNTETPFRYVTSYHNELFR